MGDALSNRRRVQETVLSLFSKFLELPIGLYEPHGQRLEPIVPKAAREIYREHCRLIQSFQGGRELCEADQCTRAKSVFDCGGEQLVCCYAGLYNNLIPIRIQGETRAVLVYGEMQLAGEEFKRKSLQNHASAVRKLKLSEDQATRLRDLLLKSKEYTPDDLKKFRVALASVEEWLFTIRDEEEELRRSIQRVTHDIATRLQGIISDADMLAATSASLRPEQVSSLANELLASTMALNTVIQTLGEYLGEYKFQSLPLQALVYEARKVYQAEAQRRGIDIQVQFQRPPTVDMARNYLQHAVNNLIHNSIKYSYRGAQGRQRTVQITGRPESAYYVLTIENYGVGILQNEIEEGLIFREKYQGKLTQGEYRTGSGMGLYFVKRVVDRHRGKIVVESLPMAVERTVGSSPYLNKFHIYLPYRQERMD